MKKFLVFLYAMVLIIAMRMPAEALTVIDDRLKAPGYIKYS